MFDVANNSWMDMSSPASTEPGGRDGHGFTTDGFWLFLHGGETQNGMYITVFGLII